MPTLAQEEADRFFSQREHHTSHPEDRSDNDSLHSPAGSERNIIAQAHTNADPDDDEDPLHEMTSTMTSTATYHLPTTRFDANTGPKGVIADAQNYDQAKKRSFRKTLSTFTNTAYSTITHPRARNANRISEKENASADNSGSELGASDDEELMREWRQNRLRELSTPGSAAQRRQSPSKRKYGRVDAVDGDGYLDALEKVGRDVVVVVCIYDPEVRRSNSMLSRQIHLLYSGDSRSAVPTSSPGGAAAQPLLNLLITLGPIPSTLPSVAQCLHLRSTPPLHSPVAKLLY